MQILLSPTPSHNNRSPFILSGKNCAMSETICCRLIVRSEKSTCTPCLHEIPETSTLYLLWLLLLKTFPTIFSPVYVRCAFLRHWITPVHSTFCENDATLFSYSSHPSFPFSVGLPPSSPICVKVHWTLKKCKNTRWAETGNDENELKIHMSSSNIYESVRWTHDSFAQMLRNSIYIPFLRSSRQWGLLLHRPPCAGMLSPMEKRFKTKYVEFLFVLSNAATWMRRNEKEWRGCIRRDRFRHVRECVGSGCSKMNCWFCALEWRLAATANNLGQRKKKSQKHFSLSLSISLFYYFAAIVIPVWFVFFHSKWWWRRRHTHCSHCCWCCRRRDYSNLIFDDDVYRMQPIIIRSMSTQNHSRLFPPT